MLGGIMAGLEGAPVDASTGSASTLSKPRPLGQGSRGVDEDLRLGNRGDGAGVGIVNYGAVVSAFYEGYDRRFSESEGEGVYKKIGRLLRTYHDMGYCHGCPSINQNRENIGLKALGEQEYAPVLRGLADGMPGRG